MTRSFIHLAALTALAFAGWTRAEAGVVTFAETRFNSNQNPQSGSGTTFSQTFAASRLVAGNWVPTGASYTSPPPGCLAPICAYPGYSEYAEALIDTTTGRGRAMAASSVQDHFGPQDARAEAGFTLTDMLTVDFNTPFSVALDLSFNRIFDQLTGNSVADFTSVYAIYQVHLTDSVMPDMSIEIQFGRTNDAGVSDQLYVIRSIVNGDTQFYQAGSTLPSILSGLAQLQSAPVIDTFRVELSLLVRATCGSLGPAVCSAALESVNSSYIRFDGAYSSQNGYSYLGVPDTSVPEPGSFLLVGAALGLWAVKLQTGLRASARQRMPAGKGSE